MSRKKDPRNAGTTWEVWEDRFTGYTWELGKCANCGKLGKPGDVDGWDYYADNWETAEALENVNANTRICEKCCELFDELEQPYREAREIRLLSQRLKREAYARIKNNR